MLKILIGGSPCTKWSIAQKNNRETTAKGVGWELFKNYLIAKEKFKPDLFLYENNKSAAQAIKDQIAHELGVGTDSQAIKGQISHEFGVKTDTQARFTYINSALVSAQNRQRFYVTNFGDIEQPKDRGILLKDILETGTDLSQKNKSYCLTASYDGVVAWNTIERCQRTMVAELVALNDQDGKSRTIKAQYGKTSIANLNYSASYGATMVAEPIRVGCLPSPDGTLKNSQGMRLYSIDGKSVSLTANGGGMGAKTGLYAMPVAEATKKGYTEILPGDCVDLTQPNSKTRRGRNMKDKCNCLTTSNEYYQYMGVTSLADGKEYPVYEVKDGKITIKGKQYPIKLVDGYYIIRKLTVTECCRLQTMPDDYMRAVSATQGYKGLGNGWTAEVIIHLLNHALKDVPRDTEIEVLSMYDGIGTGRYCLDKMGFTNVKYHAYEIDKYAMQVANDNYPDIIQHGDAFAVRESGWQI